MNKNPDCHCSRTCSLGHFPFHCDAQHEALIISCVQKCDVNVCPFFLSCLYSALFVRLYSKFVQTLVPLACLTKSSHVLILSTPVQSNYSIKSTSGTLSYLVDVDARSSWTERKTKALSKDNKICQPALNFNTRFLCGLNKQDIMC